MIFIDWWWFVRLLDKARRYQLYLDAVCTATVPWHGSHHAQFINLGFPTKNAAGQIQHALDPSRPYLFVVRHHFFISASLFRDLPHNCIPVQSNESTTDVFLPGCP